MSTETGAKPKSALKSKVKFDPSETGDGKNEARTAKRRSSKSGRGVTEAGSGAKSSSGKERSSRKPKYDLSSIGSTDALTKSDFWGASIAPRLEKLKEVTGDGRDTQMTMSKVFGDSRLEGMSDDEYARWKDTEVKQNQIDTAWLSDQINSYWGDLLPGQKRPSALTATSKGFDKHAVSKDVRKLMGGLQGHIITNASKITELTKSDETFVPQLSGAIQSFFEPTLKDRVASGLSMDPSVMAKTLATDDTYSIITKDGERFVRDAVDPSKKKDAFAARLAATINPEARALLTANNPDFKWTAKDELRAMDYMTKHTDTARQHSYLDTCFDLAKSKDTRSMGTFTSAGFKTGDGKDATREKYTSPSGDYVVVETSVDEAGKARELMRQWGVGEKLQVGAASTAVGTDTTSSDVKTDSAVTFEKPRKRSRSRRSRKDKGSSRGTAEATSTDKTFTLPTNGDKTAAGETTATASASGLPTKIRPLLKHLNQSNEETATRIARLVAQETKTGTVESFLTDEMKGEMSKLTDEEQTAMRSALDTYATEIATRTSEGGTSTGGDPKSTMTRRTSSRTPTATVTQEDYGETSTGTSAPVSVA